MALTTCGDELYSVCCIILLDCFFFFLTMLRFQIVVLSAYKQIRSQSDDILSDIDEDNYDRAFNYLRPGKSVSFVAFGSR